MATNYLRDLMDKPGSFAGSPGYQFALQQGQQAIGRRAAAGGMRGSGNVLAALNAHAVGSAQQDYGNEFNRRLAADSFSAQDELGRGRLALDDKLGTGALGVSRDRLALDDRMGTGQLELGRGRLAMDDRIGTGQLELGNRRADQDYGLGMYRATNDYDLGSRGIEAGREGRYMDYDLGKGRLGLDTTRAGNDFTLGSRAADTNAYNARTNRGSARSQDWGRRQQYAVRDWGY